MTSNGTSPILSFCMSGRDDDYTPDFRYRLETTIEFLAAAVQASGHWGKVEVVVADWGGERPLCETVRLSAAACAVARFVTVPRETVLRLQDGQDYFSTSQANNVAIRRASGTYRAMCGADILIPSHTVGILVDALESGEEILGVRPDAALIFCTRKKIPWDVVSTQPSVAAWRRFLHANAWRLDKDDCFAPGFLSGNASVIMMHAALWEEFGGICESMTGWGWSDVELTLRVNNVYPWLDMTGLGVEVFDLAHQSGGDRRSEELRRPNRYEVNAGPRVNGPAWGLRDLDLDVVRAAPRATMARARDTVDTADVVRRAGQVVNEKLTALLKDGSWLLDLFTDAEEVFTALVSVVSAEINDLSVFVDIGASKAGPAATTLSQHRWAEYVAVDWWLGSCVGIGQPTKFGYMLHSKLVGYMGRANFVSNPESLPAFLERSGFPAVDLVIFRDAVFESDAVASDALQRLCRSLSSNGMIVVRHQTGRRRLPGPEPTDIIVRDVPGLDVSLVYRRDSVVAESIGAQAGSMCALSNVIWQGLPENGVRRAWRSLRSLAAYHGAGRCVLVPRGSYGWQAVSFVTQLPAEGPQVIAVVDERPTGSPGPRGMPVVLPASVSDEAFDSAIIMADAESDKVRAACRATWGPDCRIFDFSEIVLAVRDQRFPEDYLQRIIEAPRALTLAVCGYGIHGRALVRYLQSQDPERFRFEAVVVWDNFKDKQELTALGFRCYSPDDHDEWPGDLLFAVTPLNNQGMVAQLMALLTRHLGRTGKTRLVVGCGDANGLQALQILSVQPEIVAGRIELLAWAATGSREDFGGPGWASWTPDSGPFPSADTMVLLTSISSSGMRETLERLGARRGESFVDNVLWC